MLALLLSLLPQSPPLWNVLPAPFGAAAAPLLRQALGEACTLRDVASEDLDTAIAEATGPAILFGVDELHLQALATKELLTPLPADVWLAALLPARARAVDGRYALLLQAPYTLAFSLPGTAGAELPRTWAELATSPLAQDQLGLCGPEVDPAPWLGWMSLQLRAGGVEADGYALWTALDARARYFPSYPTALQEFDRGGLHFLVLQKALARRGRELLGAAPLLCRDPDDGQPCQWYGVALLRRGEGVAPTLAPLLHPPLRQQLAAASGMEAVATASAAAAVAPATDAPAPVQQWLDHFQRRLRGQGRSLEDLDAWLEMFFTLLFFGFLYFVWRRLRRGEGDEPSTQ